MQAHEYWLLDSVIEAPFPIGLLATSPENVTGAFNRSFHGMEYSLLKDTVVRLWYDGYIRCFDADHQFLDISFDAAVVYAALVGEIDRYYEVTAAGGSAWEAVSSPDWRRYSTIGGSEEVTIAAGDQAVVEQLLACYPGIRESAHVIPESITWAVETPWRATYWKTLPTGWVVRFRTRKGPMHESASAMWRQVRQLQRWYTNPFESRPAS